MATNLTTNLQRAFLGAMVLLAIDPRRVIVSRGSVDPPRLGKYPGALLSFVQGARGMRPVRGPGAARAKAPG